MASGMHSDVKIYDTTVQVAAMEALARNIVAFNEASAGAIELRSELVPGYYLKMASFAREADSVTRRDLTSVSAVASIAQTQIEEVGVKQMKKYGPKDITSGSLATIGVDQMTYQMMSLGADYGLERAKTILDAGIIAADACLSKSSNTYYDATGQSTKTMTHAHLVKGLALMGDKAGDVVCWVMHSKPYYDLVGSAISGNVDGVTAGVMLYGATPGTLGRPVVVTDCAALLDANGSATDTYNTIGLTAGGIQVIDSEGSNVFLDQISGLEQLVTRLQAEFAVTTKIKGFAWNTSTGGSNPTDAYLGNSTYWTQAATSVKTAAGVMVITQ